MSVFILVRLNTGLHKERFLSFGPDLQDLVESVDEGAITEGEYDRLVARHIPIHINVNMQVIQALSERQSRAIVSIGIGVFLHLAAIVYIAGGVILG